MFLRNNRATELADVIRRTEAFHRWPVDSFPAVEDVVRPGGRDVDADRWR
jgi:hypothetical protein